MTDGNRTRGAQGGAHSEAGGEYRRALAALFVAHALNGTEFKGLPFGGTEAVVETVALETNAPVDDILVGLRGGRLYLQAKRTLRFGRPMIEVAEQWLRAVRTDEFDPDREYVAVGAGAISRPLKLAAKALDRRRSDPSSTWTTGEGEQVEKLEALLRSIGASEAETSLALSRAVFVERQVEEEHEPDAENGRLLLDGHVVKKGEGARAWRELISAAGLAARQRIGYSASGWLDELRKRGVQLAADAERSVAAALERQRQVIHRYLERLSERGEVIDLSAVGAQLPPLRLKDLDAEVTVRDPVDDEDKDKDLLWAFRRRGRVLLTGLPGGGKSTAVRSAAGRWAARSQWATPIVVSLRSLADKERFRKRSLRDNLLDLAVAETALKERDLLREALDRALEEGDAVLFLDGLDEAADRSLALTSDLQDLLASVHPETDVLLATRDAAYADARILGFRDLVVNAPRSPQRSVRAVLTSIAEQRDVQDRPSWIELRAEWVDRMLRVDSQLSETPLLPILLALLAGEHDVEALPSTRARILADVVCLVVERHEIRREHALAGLPEGHEPDALLGAFPRIATALAATDGAVPRAVLIDTLTPYLTEEWKLAPAPARKTAEEILLFWDESGVFVAHGSDKKTAARSQLFLEIGAAMDAAAAGSREAGAFVAAAAPRTDRHELLILAAGLSESIANELIAYAIEHSDEQLKLAAATALAQGGVAGEAELGKLVYVLIELMQPGDDVAWRAFKTLIRIRIPGELQDAVIASLDSFDLGHETVGRALAAVHWDYSRDTRDEVLEAGLRVDRLAALPRRYPPDQSAKSPLFESGIDQAFMSMKLDAASELLPLRPELAPVIVEAMEHGSMGAVASFTDILKRNGHGELAEATQIGVLDSETMQQMATQFASMENELEQALQTIATMGPPANVTRTQARRRELLASFLETLDLNSTSAWMGPDAFKSMGERWYRLIAALGDFDVGVLAAQAELVAREMDQEGGRAAFFSLFDGAKPAQLEHWGNVSDTTEGAELAVFLLAGGEALAWVCARALATHPASADVAKAAEARIPAVPKRSMLPTVWIAISLADDPDAAAERLAKANDGAVRAAVASVVIPIEDGKPTSLARALALDPERIVQLAALSGIEKTVQEPQPELVALLEQIAETPPQPFTCRYCGTRNEAARESCDSCHIVTRRPCDEAAKLVKSYAREEAATSNSAETSQAQDGVMAGDSPSGSHLLQETTSGIQAT